MMPLGFVLLAVGFACGTPASAPPSSTPLEVAISEGSETVAASDASDEEHTTSQPTFKLATFNIQVLGPTKAGRAEVISQLATIIRQYDVVTIQEVKDVSGEAPQILLNAVNQGAERTYAMLLSPRTGQQVDDRASQEQYAVLYDQAVLEALPGERLFDDEGPDLFQREPYLRT